MTTPLEAAIEAAHPVSSKRHDLWAEALDMVSARHEKYELVCLVNWLLHQRAALDSPAPQDAPGEVEAMLRDLYSAGNAEYQSADWGDLGGERDAKEKRAALVAAVVAERAAYGAARERAGIEALEAAINAFLRTPLPKGEYRSPLGACFVSHDALNKLIDSLSPEAKARAMRPGAGQ